MAKNQVCFDTSAVCRLFDSDVRLKPEVEAVTELLRLIDERKQWRAFVSPVFMVELADASDERQQQMVEALVKFSIADLPYRKEADSLTRAYINGGVLSHKHWHDLAHIAYASLHKCQYLISCDTTHVVRERTQTRVEKVNKALRYPTPQILTPPLLLEKLQ
jgi:hypothetical protein